MKLGSRIALCCAVFAGLVASGCSRKPRRRDAVVASSNPEHFNGQLTDWNRDGRFRLMVWPSNDGRGLERASVLEASGSGWREVLREAAESPQEWLEVIRIDREAEVVVLGTHGRGLGWPRSAGILLWEESGQLRRDASNDTLGDIEFDPIRGIVLLRWADLAGGYPNQPLLEYRWALKREAGRLVQKFEPLTPWIEAVESFCAGDRGVPVTPQLADAIGTCRGFVDDVRRMDDDHWEVDLEVNGFHWCNSPAATQSQAVVSLMVARQQDRFRIVDARTNDPSCDLHRQLQVAN